MWKLWNDQTRGQSAVESSYGFVSAEQTEQQKAGCEVSGQPHVTVRTWQEMRGSERFAFSDLPGTNL